MPREQSITLYTFDELSDEAKDIARDRFRKIIDASDIDDNDNDDRQTIAKILGIDFDQTSRRKPAIYWDLNPDCAAFEGYYSYAKGARREIRAYAPLDVELHRIADELQLIQRQFFYSIEARCDNGGRRGVSQKVTASSERTDLQEPLDTVEELLCDFAHWISRQISAQYEFIYSNESVDESILINSYEFDVNGHLA